MKSKEKMTSQSVRSILDAHKEFYESTRTSMVSYYWLEELITKLQNEEKEAEASLKTRKKKK